MPTFLTYVIDFIVVFLTITGISRLNFASAGVPVRLALIGLVLFLNATLLMAFTYEPATFVLMMAAIGSASFLFPDDLTSGISSDLGRYKFFIYILSVATLAAHIYLYLPITIFLTSPGEIDIHIDYLITTSTTGIMVVVYLAAGLYALAISPRIRTLLTILTLSMLLIALIYSFVAPFGYPMMNGLMFEQIALSPETLVVQIFADNIIVLAAMILVLFALRRVGGKPILIGVLLIHVSLALTSVLTINSNSITPDSSRVRTETAQNPLKFSRENSNILIIMLDRLMGGFVETILLQEPALNKDLEGFEWFPRTLSAGENSISGIHPILGGYDYTPLEMNRRKRPLVETSAESFSILPYNFSKKGYGVNFVNPSGLGFTMDGDCSFLKTENTVCTHTPHSVTHNLARQHGISMKTLAKSNYAELLFLLGIMRAMPYGPKAAFQKNGPWQPFLDHSAGTTFTQWAELKSLPVLSSAQASEPQLNIVFNTLPHEPYFMGKDCLPKPTRVTVTADELKNLGYANLFQFQHAVAARCSLLILSEYFNWMKRAGVYDNTKIVIVSDHGIRGPVTDHSSRALKGGTTANRFVRSRSTLMVKQIEAHGELSIREDFMPNAEVPSIVCEEIGGCINPYLNGKPIAADGRDIPFFVSFVPWQFNLQKRDSFNILDVDVLLEGDPYNSTFWKLDIQPE